MWRRLLWSLSALLGLTLVGALLFVVLYDFDEAIEAQKDAYLPQLTALLGREVTAGPVEATFWPHLGGTLHDVRVAGPTPSAPPLLKIDRVFLAVDSEEALYSWGTDVRIIALVLTAVDLNLTRNPDGTYAHEEVFARVRARRAANDNATLDPEGEKFIRGLRLDTLEIAGGRVVVHGAQGPPAAGRPLDRVALEFTDVARGEPYGVQLAAAVGGDTQNLAFRARLGPTVSTKDGPFTPIHQLSIRIDELLMSAVAPYLNRSHWDWSGAVIDGRWEMKDPHGLTPHTSIQGSLTVRGLRTPERADAPPFDLSTRIDLVVDRTVGRLTIKDSAVSLGETTLVVSGDISRMFSRAPHLQGVLIKTKGLDLALLPTYFPSLVAQQAPEDTPAGPAALSLQGRTAPTGPIVELKLNLDEARLSVPEVLRKTAGTTLRLHAFIHLREDNVRVQFAPLAWGPMTLNLDGRVGHDGSLALKGDLVTAAAERREIEGDGQPMRTDPMSLRVSGHLRDPRLTGPAALVIRQLVGPAGAGTALTTALEAISRHSGPETSQAPSPDGAGVRRPP